MKRNTYRAQIRGLRRMALENVCPECGAAAQTLCVGRTGNSRISPHKTRFRGVSTAHPEPAPLTLSVQLRGDNRSDQMIRDAAEGVALRFQEAFGGIQSKCESPIEEILMAALYIENNMSPETLFFSSGEYQWGCVPPFEGAAHVWQQAAIGQYRVDILIDDTTVPGARRLMVVECDGHDFHEKTKEQARRDKQRDRFLQSKGFKVLHFTGSEIWADPEKCAAEIIDELACNDEWRARAK